MEEKFNIQEELKKLPKQPGVYIMRDENDTIMYVGKAINLYNRVRSYFRKIVGRGPQIDRMVSQIARFEYIVTDSELEALVLENNLIKENSPRYNTMLKDDKTYPYIKVTVADEYPRIVTCRKVTKDSARYFGPFTSGEAVKETTDLLRKAYKLRNCRLIISDSDDHKTERKCLYYHMGQCDAPCDGLIAKGEYAKNITKVLDFLGGDHKHVISDLTKKMNDASEELRYEQAMEYRDLIESIKKVSEKQKITDTGSDNRDVIAMAREKDSVIFQMKISLGT